MSRSQLELADIFRRHGEAWRVANAGHVNLGQRRVMTAIEICRSAVLGGHVERCEDCAHTHIAYNSCRNRHCPKCQWSTARKWLVAREEELLPVPYFHFVFTLPPVISAMAYQNKAKIYGLLFKAAADTLTTIAADQKYLGADIGIIAVLHTWGQNLQHHPHVHCVVPGGGVSRDGNQWIASRPAFFLPVRVLSRLFRRLFLEGLSETFRGGELQFFADLAHLNDAKAFAAALTPLRTAEWIVYAKKTFSGPGRLLGYLARYTHRVAICNNRLLNLTETHVTFRWKGRRQGGRYKTKGMRIAIGEFMRRFLLHVLPNGFHRIRHYGFLANSHRADRLALCRTLLAMVSRPVARKREDSGNAVRTNQQIPPCPCCGGYMAVIETLYGTLPRSHPPRRLEAL